MKSFADTLARLQRSLGTDVVKAPQDLDLTRHLRDFLEIAAASDLVVGVAYPRSTADVAAIMRICHADGLPVTPQSGMTGFVGGAVPTIRSLVLSQVGS